MSKTVEFFFDFGSPASYLAWTQLPRIARESGAQIIWQPMLLGGVFKATGNQSPVMIPSKGRWMLQDLNRFALRYGVVMQFTAQFPINTLTQMRGAAGYQDSEHFEHYVTTMFDALWVQQKNLGNPHVLAEVLSAAGFDLAEFQRLVNDEAVKERLRPPPKRRSNAACLAHRPSLLAMKCTLVRIAWTLSQKPWRASFPAERSPARH
jgi:2-hydroxychromene-2-carboxylate isomerase